MTDAAPTNLRKSAEPECRANISHVIFDFDGTLSWLRNGWPDVMVETFAPFLHERPEGLLNVKQRLRGEILALNGKPSIHQMERFCELAPELKASPPKPPVLLDLYLSHLNSVVRDRADSLARGDSKPEQFVIAGAIQLLDELARRGLFLVILSGTAEPDVRREAELLGLARYFGPHIYGSIPGQGFAKRQVIDRIIATEGVNGSSLLSFGDGPVEIECTKAVGGRAVGVASDENTNGSGRMDPDKREHLIRAGADAIIPDYRDTWWILETFFP